MSYRDGGRDRGPSARRGDPSTRRARLRPGALAMAACILAPLAGCEPQAPAEEPAAASAAEVEAAFRDFAAAWEAEDLEAAAGIFTADAVAFDPVPPGRFEGAEGIRAWTAGSFEALDGISIALRDIRVWTEGPVAWLTAAYTFEAVEGEEPMSDEGYLSMVWVLQPDGTYRSTVFHASPVPEGPPVEGGAGAAGGEGS